MNAMDKVINKYGELLTPEEAAAMLKKKTGTLARWRCTKSHDLPYIKNGGTIVYKKEDIEKWLESRRVTN